MLLNRQNNEATVETHTACPEKNTPEQTALPTGWVVAYYSDRYKVLYNQQLWQCMVKGLLKKQQQTVLVGDWVVLDRMDARAKTARIASVLPRTTELQRPRVANINRVLVLAPWKQPDLDLLQLDRLLCHIALQALPVTLVFTKVDLATTKEEQAHLQHVKALYKSLGYPVECFSIYWPTEQIKGFAATALHGVTVLAGVSGAGKSSLLNAIKPGFALRVGAVSEKLERGQHTTRHVELLPLHPANTTPELWVADTPGFSQLKLEGVTAEQVEAAFTEFTALKPECAFSNCLHEHEEACGVRPWVGTAKLSRSRFEAYQELLKEAKTTHETEKNQSLKNDLGTTKLLQGKKQQGNTGVVRLSQRQRAVGRNVAKQSLKPWNALEAEPEEDV